MTVLDVPSAIEEAHREEGASNETWPGEAAAAPGSAEVKCAYAEDGYLPAGTYVLTIVAASGEQLALDISVTMTADMAISPGVTLPAR